MQLCMQFTQFALLANNHIEALSAFQCKANRCRLLQNGSVDGAWEQSSSQISIRQHAHERLETLTTLKLHMDSMRNFAMIPNDAA